MLSITDTGSGMTEDTKQHLFEPFFTTKEPGRGTGLGLSTTYGIVKQSGGCMWVSTELGRGTTFRVYLPRANAHATVPEVSARLTLPAKPASETVLLVEDEEDLRTLLQRILEKAGYHVLAAADGDEAGRVFAEHADAVALVVTDIVMPHCGGPELLSRLRHRSPELRVLYMSGYTEQSAAIAAGIDQGTPFVRKPFTAEELVRQVRGVLDR
jgi:CheY-like chemotaxis protein